MSRLFFGTEVYCPWPEEFPNGRTLAEEHRHLTLAFLGETNMPDMSSFPKPQFSIGLVGIFDNPLFLKHVVAWNIKWIEDGIKDYQKRLFEWLKLEKKRQEFFSHVTIARKPCDEKAWKESFHKLPLFIKNINLYESLGNSEYKIVWQHPVKAPFEEIAHAADIAFIVRGNLFLHAQMALAFHFPQMLQYLSNQEIKDKSEIVRALNRIISKIDSEIGCPFKAVSFHGTENESEEWEMIVDV